eukprot:TRINITY_DN19745_c0_g1_i1.p1 TRINITY_DN19745_c0_g1~~TRINITY_DN19745_c0_g1_i1.p1  ORF type:complete len:187 (+),score=14.00 TRINITY_DN19745_c0_g1_i1:58-618(+)
MQEPKKLHSDQLRDLQVIANYYPHSLRPKRSEFVTEVPKPKGEGIGTKLKKAYHHMLETEDEVRRKKVIDRRWRQQEAERLERERVLAEPFRPRVEPSPQPSPIFREHKSIIPPGVHHPEEREYPPYGSYGAYSPPTYGYGYGGAVPTTEVIPPPSMPYSYGGSYGMPYGVYGGPLPPQPSWGPSW